MARGGGGRGRRTYVRDGNGRFASTPGGGKPKVTGGTLKARSSLGRSRRRLAAQNPSDRTIQGSLSRRSQKGAVTRGQKALATSRQANRMTVSGAGVKGVVRKGGKGKVGAVVKAMQKRVSTPTKGLRVLARAYQVGERRTGVKAVTAQRTQTRAKMYLLALRGSSSYTRGSKKGQPRPFGESMKQLTGNLSSKRARAEAAAVVVRTLGNKPLSRKKSVKLSANQRMQAEAAKRKYGKRSTAAPKSRITGRRELVGRTFAPAAPLVVRARGIGSTVRKPADRVSAVKRGRVVYRTRSQAIANQRARSNALGRSTANKRGFNDAVTRRPSGTFAEPAPRTVIGRPRVSQMTLSGRTERVGAGRFRTIGERRSSGSVSRPRKVKPSPIRGSKSYQREVQRLIRQNGGKDVAAFHL